MTNELQTNRMMTNVSYTLDQIKAVAPSVFTEAKAPQETALPGVNVMLMGPAGTGKTHSIGTLADAGLEVFYLGLESGLESLYGYYTDKGFFGEAADLFTDDASFQWGNDGIYKGKARINAFEELMKSMVWRTLFGGAMRFDFARRMFFTESLKATEAHGFRFPALVEALTQWVPDTQARQTIRWDTAARVFGFE